MYNNEFNDDCSSFDWILDTNKASPSAFGLIPAGTITKVELNLKTGDYVGNSMVSTSFNGSLFLNINYKIIEGKYKGRLIFDRIGLKSAHAKTANNDKWQQMGLAQMRSIIDSAHGFTYEDNSDKAQKARKISSFEDLKGLTFPVLIKVETRPDGTQENAIRVLSVRHPQYKSLMEITDIPF